MYYRSLPHIYVTDNSSPTQLPHMFSTKHANLSSFAKSTEIALKKNKTKNAFLVDTSSCKIPNISPYDKSIKHLLEKGSGLKCATKYDVVYQIGNTLHINKTEIRNSGLGIKICGYDVVWRSYNEEVDHNFYEYQKRGTNFTSSINITDEFVRVRCFNSSGETVYTNFFAFVLRKDEVETRCMEDFLKFAKTRKESLSVMMIGVDSISRNNMLRYMKKTWSYLTNTMSAFDLLAYNKVADNTFVNIVPMTTGKYVEELPWNETIRWTPLDEYNFIWNNYSSNGYRVQYAEDYPDIAIFDYGKSGFRKTPGDYYNRPLSLAAERTDGIWTNNHYCLHARSETDFVLDYVKRFGELFRVDPYFSFSFITRLTHSYLEETYKADILYFRFLKEMHENGHLNNTVLFFFSDHGMRFGHVRETFVGKLEERLPFMLIAFPPWFLKKYPQVQKNLQINTRRLATPFDIFGTLEHILQFNGKPSINDKKVRALSLLNEIPEDRSCEDAGILPHWCTCSSHENLDVKNETVIEVGLTMVEKINGQLEKVLDVCEKLTLKTIRYALRIVPSDKVLRFEQSKNDVVDRHVVYGERANPYIDYQVTLQTSPGGAVFEGTIRFDEENKSYDLVGDVSRINKYGEQSHCIDVHHLRKLCYCKIQLNP